MVDCGDLDGDGIGERERDLERRRGEPRIGERRLRSDLAGERGRRDPHRAPPLYLAGALRRGGDSRRAFGGGGGGRSYGPP